MGATAVVSERGQPREGRRGQELFPECLYKSRRGQELLPECLHESRRGLKCSVASRKLFQVGKLEGAMYIASVPGSPLIQLFVPRKAG